MVKTARSSSVTPATRASGLGTPPRRELDPAARMTPTGSSGRPPDGPGPTSSIAGSWLSGCPMLAVAIRPVWFLPGWRRLIRADVGDLGSSDMQKIAGRDA
jgi:hypothetical protein